MYFKRGHASLQMKYPCRDSCVPLSLSKNVILEKQHAKKQGKRFDLMQKATTTIGRSDSIDQKINEHGYVTIPSELLKQIAKQPETQYLETSSLPSHLNVINTDSSNQSLQEHSDVLITKKFIKPEGSLEVVASTLTTLKDTHFGDIVLKQ